MKMNKELTQDQFKGVWPALLTPINASGTPNLKELEKFTELIISQGLDGLYILGSTGQGVLLSEDQRKTVAEVITSVNNGRLPIIVHVGSMTTDESVSLATHASKLGVQGISSVGPIYYGGSSDMALQHYRQIANATDLPFFPYQLGAGKFSEGIPEFIDKLLKIPHVTGMKLTTGNLLDISAIHSNSRDSLILFSGADELMCHASLCGTVGAIGSFYNLWGPECQKVRNEFVNGNVKLGTTFMLTFQEVIAQVLPNVWTFLQQAMNYRYGIDIGKAIEPLGNTHLPWSEKEIIEIVERIIKASEPK
jgi:N-acetylneuraminate lyase